MNEALTAAWLQELWPTCREVSREERAVERARHAVDAPSNARAKAQVNRYSEGAELNMSRAGRSYQLRDPGPTPEAPEVPLILPHPCPQQPERRR